MVLPMNTRERLARESTETDSEARTTWEARVVRRGSGAVVAGATVVVHLLSPSSDPKLVRLVSDEQGEVGPIEIDVALYPAAEVSVPPGVDWSFTARTMHFAPHRPHRDILEVGPSASVAVRVVEAGSGLGVANADVSLEMGTGAVPLGNTDSRGLLVFPWAVPGGPFQLRAAARGFVPLERVELDHPPSEDREVEIRMAPEGRLRVSVLDAEQRPQADCLLDASTSWGLLGTSPASLGARTVPQHWDALQDSGSFLFPAAPCGVELTVRAWTGSGSEGRVSVTVPPSTRFAEATITLAAAKGLRIQAVDAQASPLAGVTVSLGAHLLGTTDEHGTLLADVPRTSREREFWAFKPGYAFAWVGRGSEDSDVVLRLYPEQRIGGVVVDSSALPQRLVRVSAMIGRPDEPRDVRQRRGEWMLERTSTRRTGTPASGEFALHGLPEGWCDIFVRPPKSSPFLVRDVPVGTSDLIITIPDETTLGRGKGLAFGVLVLDRRTGAPIRDAAVGAFLAQDLETKSATEGRWGRTRRDGRARLATALEGPYWIEVSADGYVPFSGSIEEYPPGEYDLEIELLPSAELEVLVRGPSGAALPGYWVSARDASLDPARFHHAQDGGLSSGPEIVTGADGIARANRMPEGPLILEVRQSPGREGDALLRHRVLLRAGERTRAELNLP